jgi:TM2 domain-containing membrane protein YozV
MNQKVWVIRGHYEGAAPNAPTTGGLVTALHPAKAKQKDPALAYSMSLFIWGCGQLYNRRWKSGALLFLFMIIFCLSMSMIVMYWTFLVNFFGSINISRSGTFLICVFLYLAGLLTWYLNSCHAYFNTIKINGNPFEGLKSVFLPAVCSLFMPGWGQFLNGQPKKGICFQIFSLAGFVAFPAMLIIFLVWPTMEASQARLIVEWIFTVSIISTPLILMMWLFSIYDAARISMDKMKKEPLGKRIRYQISRYQHNIQIYGWKNAMLQIIKRIVVIMLLLTFGVISYRYIPRVYYIQQLQDLGDRVSQQEMTVLPDLINDFCNNITTGR